MKFRKQAFFLLFSILTLIIFQGSSTGIGASQNLDMTGAPGSSGNCSACHWGGSYKASLEYTLRDTSTMKAVTSVNSGQTYTVIWRVKYSGSPSAFGFQGTARNTSNGTAGTWTTLSPNGRISTVSGKKLVEQKFPSAVDSFAYMWTAPTNVDTVMFYGSGNAVNGNQGTSGDSYGTLLTPKMVMVNHAAGVERFITESSINFYPSPADNFVHFKGLSGITPINVYNNNGELVLSQNLDKGQALNTSQLTNGLFFVSIGSGNNKMTKRLVVLHQ